MRVDPRNIAVHNNSQLFHHWVLGILVRPPSCHHSLLSRDTISTVKRVRSALSLVLYLWLSFRLSYLLFIHPSRTTSPTSALPSVAYCAAPLFVIRLCRAVMALSYKRAFPPFHLFVLSTDI